MLLSALPLSPARVFAELLAPPLGARGRENEPVPGLLGGRSSAVPPGREVHVSGSAELCAAPDRARISIRLGSRKQEAGEARSSVTRRLEYIAQSVRQRGVQDLEISCEGPSLHSGHCFVEDLEGNLPLNPAHKLIMKFCTSMSKENVTVTKDFSRVENAYQMEAEVCITFSDFGKMQNVCNLLIEKLGSSVTISPPHFYHTAEAIDTLRRQVCLAAVGNTRRKAQEVCRLFGQSLGKPLLIREEEMKEWEGQIDSHPSNSSNTLTVQQRIQSATIYASSKIFAIFEIKRQEKRKNKLI